MLNKDVIVIGAGCAGMIAALEAAGAGASAVLLDRGAIGVGTNSAISNGIFSGASTDYSAEEHIADTLKSGKGLNRVCTVRLIAERATEAFDLLRSLGVELMEFRGGVAIRSRAADRIRGITLVRGLISAIRRTPVETMERFDVLRIISTDGQAAGVEGFDSKGRRIAIRGRSIVLASGGAAGVYLRNDNQKRTMGQGFYLAAKAGLKLLDMEFVQFFPLVLAQPGAPSTVVYGPYPSEARILDHRGEDLMIRHGLGDPNTAIEKKRDEFSAVLFNEGLSGPVYMDYTRVPASLFSKRPLSLLPHRKIDFGKTPFIVSPAAHFCMGGVETDDSGQTSIQGLFACGEVVWGLHGANRMMGNALTECAVTGMIAGRRAALYAREHELAPLYGLEAGEFRHRRPSINSDLKELRQQLKEAAWRFAGVARTEQGLKDGIAKLLEINSWLQWLEPGNVRDTIALEDLRSGAFFVRCVLEASLLRKESRGAFIRTDKGAVEDQWRSNSLIGYDSQNKSICVSFRPVAEAYQEILSS